MGTSRSIRSRVKGIAFAIATLTAFSAQATPASAQGLFDMLFGGGAPRSVPAQTSAFADPFGLFGRNDAPRRAVNTGGGGGGAAYCVRTCDGRFFPLQRQAGTSPAELCKSFCPASRTAVFTGGQIDNAVAPGIGRYADMDNAFVYRTKVVDNCTCNGKDAFGLARVDIAEDPTLKKGDIVATSTGLATFAGKSGAVAQYTPIKGSAGEWARRLAETKVMAVAPVEKVEPIADETPAKSRRRSAQRAAQVTR